MIETTDDEIRGRLMATGTLVLLIDPGFSCITIVPVPDDGAPGDA